MQPASHCDPHTHPDSPQAQHTTHDACVRSESRIVTRDVNQTPWRVCTVADYFVLVDRGVACLVQIAPHCFLQSLLLPRSAGLLGGPAADEFYGHKRGPRQHVNDITRLFGTLKQTADDRTAGVGWHLAGAGFALRCWLCSASADVVMRRVYGALLVAMLVVC